MAELEFTIPIGCECPFEETNCEFRQAYNEALAYILTGQVNPDEFKLENIIEEIKSWTFIS